MHNDIMAASSRDHLPMLATRRYAQWQSCFLRYVDTKSNKQELKQCIFDGPYVMTEVTFPAKPATTTEGVPEHNVPKTYENTSPKKHAYIDAEAEVVHMILSGIGYDIYSTVDACTTAKEIWIAIERLQQDLDKESYHNLFEFIKQYHNEVNKIYVKKISRNANLFALVAVAQHYLEYHNQAPIPHKPNASSLRQTTSTKSHTTTKHKGKEIVKPITPPSESASEEVMKNMFKEIKHIIIAGAKNHPLMLEKSMYDSWASRIRLFIKGKKNGRMMLDSIDNGLLVYLTVEENGLYNLFDKFAHVQGETLYEYYWRFSQLINDMHTIGMTMQQLAKSLYTTNYDQLYAYLSQHERHSNEVRIMHSGLVVPTFQQGEDLIDCINKAMSFLSVVASRGRHMGKQCTEPKRPRSSAWFKEKLMLAEAQEASQILDEEQLTFIANPRIAEV
ncbi:hypothetical protein Tco_0610786 [Tanacetum coccineum]